MQRNKLKIGDVVAVKWCGDKKAVVLDFGWVSSGLHGVARWAKLRGRLDGVAISFGAERVTLTLDQVEKLLS